MTEEVKKTLCHAFESLRLERIWSGYYSSNKRSKRVLEKVWFEYQRTEDIVVLLPGGMRTCHITLLTKKRWNNLRMQLC